MSSTKLLLVFFVCFFWDIPRQDWPKLETRSAPIPLVSSIHVRGIFLQIPSQIPSDTALPLCSPSSYLWHEIFSMAITLTGFVRSYILFICSASLDLDSQWYLNQQISLLSFAGCVVSWRKSLAVAGILSKLCEQSNVQNECLQLF